MSKSVKVKNEERKKISEFIHEKAILEINNLNSNIEIFQGDPLSLSSFWTAESSYPSSISCRAITFIFGQIPLGNV